MKSESRALALVGSVVGILASLIAVFTFVTGRSSLSDSSAGPSPSDGVAGRSSFSDSFAEPNASQVPGAPQSAESTPLLSGAWDRQVANAAVLEILDSYSNAAFGFNGQEIQHEIIDQYYLKFDDYASYVVIASTSPVSGHHCHACAVPLSFIEFRQQEAGWDLGTQSVAAIEQGSWGTAPSADSIRALVIGRNTYGIAVEVGWLGQGYLEGFTAIYADIAGTFKEIFSAQTSLARYDDIYWDSEILVKKEGHAPFYDILLKRSGDHPNEPKEVLYQFDGRRYAPSEVYR